MNVNHEEKKYPVGTQIYTCKPGQSFRSIEKWTAIFHCSKKTTIKFFEMLKKDDMIMTETIGRGNRRKHLLTVCNWEKYQFKETENSTEIVPECSANGNSNVPPNNNKKQLINNEEQNIKADFEFFFNAYHNITGKSKTDKQAAYKYYKGLSKIEQKKAFDNIEVYYKSLSDKKYCKKCRTYLSDKNFNDEFSPEVINPIPEPNFM